MQDSVAPSGQELVVDTHQGARIDLLEMLQIDPVACAGRNIRAIRVTSGGNGILYLLENGERSNDRGAIVDRNVAHSLSDRLYTRDASLEISQKLKSFELEILPYDEAKNELRIYRVEVIEND